MRHGIENTLVLRQDEVYRDLKAESLVSHSISEGPFPRPLFIAHLTDGFATHQGAYITRDSRLIGEFSQYFDSPIETHRYLHSLRLFRKIKKVDRPVFALAGAGQYNYHHWWVDILPKFHLIQKYGNVPSNVLYYVETSKSFQTETLRFLGINSASLLDSRETQTLRAREIIVASPRSPLQRQDPWVVAWIRKTFLSMAEDYPGRPHCVLISRKGAKTRGVVNEDEIAECLAPLNPVTVELEKLTVAQQIGLFAGAKWIIAPHGAGLTNVLFAPKDCRIIELFGSTQINECYRFLAENVGCPHTPLLGEDVIDSQTGQTHIRVNITLLKKAVFGDA